MTGRQAASVERHKGAYISRGGSSDLEKAFAAVSDEESDDGALEKVDKVSIWRSERRVIR